MGGDVAQLVERQTSMALRQVRFPGVKRDFSPRVNFQYRLSYGVHTSPCAIACVNICLHVKDPVVHVRVQWITGTVKHPACTVGWVALLCHSWLSLGKENLSFSWAKQSEFPMEEIPKMKRTIQLLKKNLESHSQFMSLVNVGKRLGKK